jgi:hypothetical protein
VFSRVKRPDAMPPPLKKQKLEIIIVGNLTSGTFITPGMHMAYITIQNTHTHVIPHHRNK